MSLELWKSSLLTMPDSSFFDLIHSALGKIKTPFNKQKLIKELESFLRRKDIQRVIGAFIDANDAKVITAVALFNTPTQKELENFFIGEFSFMQLYDIIVNLEERFILYRIKDSESKSFNQMKLAINPVLETILAPFSEDISILFPVRPPAAHPAGAAHHAGAKKSVVNKAVLNDCIIAGLLSFVSATEKMPFYKKEGQLRKQILSAAKNCFADLNLEETIGALQVLGLFHIKEEYLIPDKNRFTDFALLSSRIRMEYCAAALSVFKETVHSATEIQASYYRNRVKEAFNFIHALTDLLLMIPPAKKHYSERTIIKLAYVLKSRVKSAVNINNLTEIFIKTGLNCDLRTANHSPPSIIIDSSFSILVYPEIDFSDAVELASFLNIKETGAVTRFELEKDSAVRAFNNGITAMQIIDTLDRLSCKKTPETLIWNLKDWEKRYGEVSLKRGIVLTLSKDKQFISDTKSLSALITETLAPGVYLLNEDAEEELIEALHDAGIDIIARKKNTAACKANDQTGEGKNGKHFKAQTGNYFPSAEATVILHKLRPVKTAGKKTGSSADQEEAGALALKKDFYAILEKIPLDKAERDALSARIERRLILCESQLKEASIRYEKLEARNMDYPGKINIAKKAIATDSPVEIVTGKKHIYGMPCALEKETDAPNAGCILVIIPDGGEDAQSSDCARIPLAKISLIRQIKKSIFEG